MMKLGVSHNQTCQILGVFRSAWQTSIQPQARMDKRELSAGPGVQVESDYYITSIYPLFRITSISLNSRTMQQ
jgi:hypothetical protein